MPEGFDGLTGLRLQVMQVEQGFKRGLWETSEEAFTVLNGDRRNETLAQAAKRVVDEKEELERYIQKGNDRIYALEQALIQLEMLVGATDDITVARALVSKAALTARRMGA